MAAVAEIATTAAAIAARGAERLARAAALQARIARTAAPYTRASVLEPLNDLLLELNNVQVEASLVSEVHPDKSVRDAEETLQRDAVAFSTRLQQDHGLYEKLGAVPAGSLDPVARRMVELLRRDARRAGVELPEATRARAEALRTEITALGQEYSRNIRDSVLHVEVHDASDLAGLPEDYVAAHAPGPDGVIRISTDPPDLAPVLGYATSGRLRRELVRASERRASANVAVFQRLRERRHELATTLGYACWSDYANETRMAGSTERVRSFLRDVGDAARAVAGDEFAALLALKRRDDPTATTLGSWDRLYYLNVLRRQRVGHDAKAVRPYFEYRTVRQAILDLGSELFDMTFTPVVDPERWHPSVESFDVTIGGEPRGRISLDMHPRPNKSKWFTCFSLRRGIKGKQPPHIVLVCNFPDPSAVQGPALMEHGQVVTFFHEFGHLVHSLACGEVEWVRLSRVDESDFVEAPSRFLEDWIFDHEVLLRFARHVETGEPIPAAVVAKLREARDLGRGLLVEQSVFQSTLSVLLHDRDPRGTDARAITEEAERRLSRFAFIDDGLFPVNWVHMSGDQYSASYYTYLWSNVIAKELGAAFTKGLLDTAQTRRYRDLVLAPGGTRPAGELVRDFLGRPYTFDAFREWLAPRKA